MDFEFIVDTREDAPLKQKAIEKYENTKLEALYAGDFACRKDEKLLIGIERKTLIDFYGSIVGSKKRPARMFKQIEKLHETYPVVILLLEGRLDMLYVTLAQNHVEFKEGLFWETIASIVVRDNFTIFWSHNVSTSLQMAHMICTKIAEGKYQLLRLWKPKTKNTNKDLLKLIPGVTEIVASRLLKKYGSIAEIGKQSREQLCTVNGVGPTIASRILGRLH